MKNKKVVKRTGRDVLVSAILAQFEEQYRIGKKINEEEILSSLSISDLKKIHKLNAQAIELTKNVNTKDLKSLIKLGLSFMN